jgi:hypothetical protein
VKKLNKRGRLKYWQKQLKQKKQLFLYQEYLMPELTQVGHAESVYFTGSVGEHPFPEQATSISTSENFELVTVLMHFGLLRRY